MLISETAVYINENVKVLKNSVIVDSSENDENNINILSNIYCYCVKTVRELGLNIPYNTDANTFVSNTTPQIGASALFKFPNNTYHVAYIADMASNGFYVLQGNKIDCEYTEEWILWDNPYLTGFWKDF